MFKVDNTNTRARCEICSELTIKTPTLTFNFKHISHLVLVFLLLTLRRLMLAEIDQQEALKECGQILKCFYIL